MMFPLLFLAETSGRKRQERNKQKIVNMDNLTYGCEIPREAETASTINANVFG